MRERQGVGYKVTFYIPPIKPGQFHRNPVVQRKVRAFLKIQFERDGFFARHVFLGRNNFTVGFCGDLQLLPDHLGFTIEFRDRNLFRHLEHFLDQLAADLKVLCIYRETSEVTRTDYPVAIAPAVPVASTGL